MAIQQADKLLKKHKDLHCAKVSSGFVCNLLNSLRQILCHTLWPMWSFCSVLLASVRKKCLLLFFTYLSFLRRTECFSFETHFPAIIFSFSPGAPDSGQLCLVSQTPTFAPEQKLIIFNFVCICICPISLKEPCQFTESDMVPNGQILHRY